MELALAAEEYDRIHQNGDGLDLMDTCSLMRDMMLDTLWRGKMWCGKPFSQRPPNGVLSVTRRITSNVRRWVAVARATKEQLPEIKDWKRLALGFRSVGAGQTARRGWKHDAKTRRCERESWKWRENYLRPTFSF